MKRKYFTQLLISIDQLANALFAGWADETISSRAYRSRKNGSKKWAFIEKCINILFFLDKKVITNEWLEDNVLKYNKYTIRHCELAYTNEKSRQHLAPEFRV